MSDPGRYSKVDEIVMLDSATDDEWHLPLVKAPDGAPAWRLPSWCSHDHPDPAGPA